MKVWSPSWRTIPSCPSSACSARIEKVGHDLFPCRKIVCRFQFLYSVWKLSRSSSPLSTLCLFLGLPQQLLHELFRMQFLYCKLGPTFKLPQTVHRVMERVSKTLEFPLTCAFEPLQFCHQIANWDSLRPKQPLKFFHLPWSLLARDAQAVRSSQRSQWPQDRRLSPTTCSTR